MANTPASPADALIKSADRAGENTASSAMDKTFQDFQLPTDPNKLGQMYGDVASDLYDSLGIGSALDRTKSLGDKSAVATAATMFESRYKSEELSKTPVGELDQEIGRLSEQRWGILPAIMGRSDILDYGVKMQMATRAQQIMDGEIDRLTNSRKQIADAADARAKNRVEEKKAEAAWIDKQVTAAQNDLNARMDLFRDGKASFDDVVQAAMELRKINDEKAKAGSGDGNPFLGMGTGAGQFPPAMVMMFGAFEKTGEFPGVDSTKLQLKQQLTIKYGEWVAAGRPGSQIAVPGAPSNVQSTMTTKDVAELYATPAAAKQATGFWGSLPAPLATPVSGGGAPGSIDESGEYTPPK